MKTTLAAAVMLGIAVLGTAAPVAADEDDIPHEMRLDKDEVVQDETFTLSSVDPCAFDKVPGFLLYGVIKDHDLNFIEEFELTPDADGTWSMPLAMPTSVPLGKVTIQAVCYDASPNDPGTVPQEFWYGEQSLLLGKKSTASPKPGAPGSPGTPATVAPPSADDGTPPPARAVRGRPRFTG